MKITTFIRGLFVAYALLFPLILPAQDSAPGLIDKQIVKDLNQTPNQTNRYNRFY